MSIVSDEGSNVIEAACTNFADNLRILLCDPDNAATMHAVIEVFKNGENALRIEAIAAKAAASYIDELKKLSFASDQAVPGPSGSQRPDRAGVPVVADDSGDSEYDDNVENNDNVENDENDDDNVESDDDDDVESDDGDDVESDERDHDGEEVLNPREADLISRLSEIVKGAWVDAADAVLERQVHTIAANLKIAKKAAVQLKAAGNHTAIKAAAMIAKEAVATIKAEMEITELLIELEKRPDDKALIKKVHDRLCEETHRLSATILEEFAGRGQNRHKVYRVKYTNCSDRINFYAHDKWVVQNLDLHQCWFCGKKYTRRSNTLAHLKKCREVNEGLKKRCLKGRAN